MATEMLHADATPEPDWNAMEPEAFANAMEARLTEAGAILTCDQMDEIEQRWRDRTMERRCSLIMLTEEYPNLRQKVIEDKAFAEAMVSVLHAARAEAKFLKGLSDLMEAVDVRAMMALVHREDMQQLFAEYEAE